MRIKRAKTGDYRIKKKFAWLPITSFYNDNRETRWLEFVYLKEKYRYDHFAFIVSYYWETICFVSKEEYDNYIKGE